MIVYYLSKIDWNDCKIEDFYLKIGEEQLNELIKRSGQERLKCLEDDE